MDWKNGYFVKLYRSASPDWLALPVLTRGLFAELMLLADRAGRIQLGRAGVASVAIPLRATDATIGDVMQHVQRLLDDGCIYVDGDALVIRNFVDAQSRALTSTERSQKLREEGKAPSKPSKGKGKRPVQRDATDATISGTDATQRNGCNDKEQTEQNKQIRTEEAEARETPSASTSAAPPEPGTDAASILAMLRYRRPLAAIATLPNAETLAGRLMSAPKPAQHVALALDDLARDAKAADDNDECWSAKYMATQAAKYIDRASGPRAVASVTGSRGGSYPRPTETPSIASQLPFSRAPREAS